MHCGPPLLRSLVGWRNIDLIDTVTEMIIAISVIRHSVGSCSLDFSTPIFFFFSSLISLPVCYCEQMTHLSFIHCLLELFYSFFYLSEQVIRPVSLLQPCTSCYLSVILIQKGDHPLSSSALSELPSPAD